MQWQGRSIRKVTGGRYAPLRGKRRIVTTLGEHPSIYEVFRSLEGAPDTEVIFIGLRPDGTANLDELAAALTPDTALVSLMHVSNEVGAVNDLSAAATLIKQAAPNALLHADGEGQSDHSALAKFYEKLTGAEITRS